jgi:hypothetical protein
MNQLQPIQQPQTPQKNLQKQKPQTRTQLIKEEAELLKNGDKTLLDIGLELRLTPQQIEFCQIYISKDAYGDAISSYCQVFELDEEHRQQRIQARNGANAFLKDANIITFLGILLDSDGLNESHVNKELLFLIDQNADYKVKVQAIGLFHAINNTAKASNDLKPKPSLNYESLTDDELKTLIAITEKASPSNFITSGNITTP